MYHLPKPWPSIFKFLGLASLGLTVLWATTSRRVQGQQGRNETVVQVNQVQGAEPVQAFVEDEFIVVLKREHRAGFRATQGPSNRPAVSAATLQQLIDRHRIGQFRRQFPAAGRRPLGSALPDLTGHFKVRIPRGVSLDAVVADFANDPAVDHVEKIGIHPVFITPNDSFYLDQWQHHGPSGIDSNLAWERSSGHPGVVVAVLDTGVHHNHPDLNANVWVNSGEVPNNGIDDDNNGYIDDTTGYDFVESATGASLFTCCDADCGTADNDPSDHNGHGTHVAGIVAAVTNNGIGVSGIAGGFSGGTPQSAGNGVRLMPLRVGWNGALLGLLCGNGLIRMDYAAEALHYVAAQKAAGVNVAAVNCSWGSSDTGGLGAAVDEVLASDILIVHAAGNSGDSTVDYLGSKAGVMSVAATDQNGAGASFTNFGDYVEISAPGVDILSTWLGPDPNTAYYATASGTSMASPHVSAVAGLLESLNPGLTASQKFNLIVSNTKPYVNDGRNLGAGIANANLALAAAGPATPDFLVSSSPGSRVIAVGGTASYDLTVTALSGFTGTIDFSAAGLPSGASASFDPSSVMSSGTSTMTVTTGAETPTGTYPITITAAGGGLSHTVNVTLKVEFPGAALFVTTDTATQGTWQGVYGAEGYAIANDTTNYPAYAQVSLSGQSEYTWASSTTDVRALQKGAGIDRIASTWVSGTSFDIDVNLSDGNWHQVGIYCVDYDNWNRAQRVDVLDAISGSVLDTRSLAGFQNGQYLVWNLAGHVKIRLTTLTYNAVASGIFFDLPAPPDFGVAASPSVQSVASGGNTSYDVTVSSSAGFSGAVSFSASGLPAGASASFNPSSVTGSGTSAMTVTTGLATPGGSYPITITGTSESLSRPGVVTLVVTVSVPAAAGFITTDTGTQGTWNGVYGAEGYGIASHATSYPAYAQVSISGQTEYTWAGSTTDVRALQKPATADRIASTWVSGTNFDIDVNLTDGNWHQVGIYCVDYDNQNRSQRVDVLDAVSENVLDTRTLSGFQNGRYLIWNLAGHVKIRLTTLAYNAVASGIFFDLPTPADFAVSASPSVQTVASGGNTSYDVTVSSSAGFSGAVSFSASGLPPGASASFNPSSVMGSGTSTMTVTTGLATPAGSYPITITGTSGSLSHPVGVTLVVSVSVPAAVGFITTDTATQGTWKGVYGAEGYAISSHANSYPAYAQVSLSGQSEYTWAGSTTDVRALQKPAATDRIASTWVSVTNFDIDVNLTDGNWHQVGIYCVDYDNQNRSQRVDVLDAVSGNVLDTRSLSGFQNGRYLIWNLAGHVKIRLTTLAYNAVASGIFFDLPAPPDFGVAASPSVQTVASGGNTSYDVTVSSLAGFSGAVSFSASGLPAGASASFNPSSVMGSGVSTMTVTTGLTTPGGSYPITITGTSGSLSHPAIATLVVGVSVPAAAAFITTDTGTQGTWKEVYGADGYAIASHVSSYPAYAQVNLSGQSEYTWAGSTTDVRALQKPAATDRIASTWVSGTNFDIDVNLTDGNWHQVGIYCVDYDNWNRSQRVDVLDAVSESVLDTQSLSAFQNGRYLVWNLAGHVKIRLTTLAYNAVVSGIFFDVPAPAISTFSPGSGAIGDAVIIDGTGFTNASKVTFNTTDQTVLTVIGDTQITTTVPAGATSGAIHVTTPGGTATSSGSFMVLVPPTITSFNPNSGQVGDTVVITGTNLTGTTVVTFNATNATVFTVNSDTQITTTVPAGATSGAIQVTTPNGTATSSSFTVVPSAPAGLTATAGSGQVSLSWTSVGGANSYNVKRSTTNGGPYSTIASPTGTSYLNTGLTNGVTYYYVVSAVNADVESANSTQVSATPQALNQAPVVSAGEDQTISLPNTATLNGSVLDDGLPSNTLTITWSQISGPGTVTFGNPNATVTTASFSAAGSYVLRLTGSDGALSNSDDAGITVRDLIFANGFESGNLSFWSSSVTDGSNLSVSTAALLVGSFGMQALINDNNPIYVTDESPTAESRYRARFYFHPNAIPMNNGNAHFILQGLSSNGTVILQVEFRRSSGQYQLRASSLNDGTGFSNTSWFSITNAPHSVELDWRASTAPGANNGGVTFWIDGVQRANLSAVDNDTRRIERVRLGAVSGIDNATRGTYYFDAFESRRSTYIGPVVP